MRIWRDLFILIGVFAVVWGAFTFYPLINKDTDFSISIDKEQEIGRQLMENYLLNAVHNDSINHPDVNAFVDSVFSILSADYDLKFDYTFIVVNDSQINAFAMPGGYIVFNSGLLQFCSSPEEFASVMAHEIGHIENRHLINRLLKRLGLAILLSGDVTVVGEVSQTAIATVFDRKQEREADEFSMKMLEKANVSPRSLAKFFRKLETEGMTFNKNVTLLMTHPHNDERIKAALSYPLSDDFIEEKMSLNLDLVKEILAGY
jgi:beta-barrel assembly-enhancing protease